MADIPSGGGTFAPFPNSGPLQIRRGGAVVPFTKLMVSTTAKVLEPQINPTTVQTVVAQGVSQQLVTMAGGECAEPDGNQYGFIISYDTSAQLDDYGEPIDGGPQTDDITRTLDTTPGNSVTLGKLTPRNLSLPYTSDVVAGVGIKKTDYGKYPYTTKSGASKPAGSTKDSKVKRPKFDINMGRGLCVAQDLSTSTQPGTPSIDVTSGGAVELSLGDGLKFGDLPFGTTQYGPSGAAAPTGACVPVMIALQNPSGMLLDSTGLAADPDLVTIGYNGQGQLAVLGANGQPTTGPGEVLDAGPGIVICQPNTSATSSSSGPATSVQGANVGPTVVLAAGSAGASLTPDTYTYWITLLRSGVESHLSPPVNMTVGPDAELYVSWGGYGDGTVTGTQLYRSKGALDQTPYLVPDWPSGLLVVPQYIDILSDVDLGPAYVAPGSQTGASTGGVTKPTVAVHLATYSDLVQSGLCTTAGDDGKDLTINLADASGQAIKAVPAIPTPGGMFASLVPSTHYGHFYEGHGSYLGGAAQSDSPYVPGSPDAIWWTTGWLAAKGGYVVPRGLYGLIVQGGGGAGGGGAGGGAGAGTGIIDLSGFGPGASAGSSCFDVPCGNNLTGSGLTIIAGDGNQLAIHLASGGGASSCGSDGTGGNGLTITAGDDQNGLSIDLCMIGGMPHSGLVIGCGDDCNGLSTNPDNKTIIINGLNQLQVIGMLAQGQPNTPGGPVSTPGGTPSSGPYGGPGSTLNPGGNPGVIPSVPPPGSSSGYIPGGACVNPTAQWVTPTGDWNFQTTQDLNGIAGPVGGFVQLDVSAFPNGWTLNTVRVHDTSGAAMKVGKQQFPNLPSNVKGWFVMMHFEKGPDETYDWFGFSSFGSGNGGYQADGWSADTCGLLYNVASDTWHIYGNDFSDKGAVSVQPGGSANLALYVDCLNVPHFFLGASGGNLTDVTHDVAGVGTVVDGSFSHEENFAGTANVRYYGATVSGFRAAVGLPSTITINNFNGSGTTYVGPPPPCPSNIPSTDCSAWNQGYLDFQASPTATAPPTCPYGPNTFSDQCKAYAMGWWDAYNAAHAGSTTTPPQPANGSGGSTIGITPTNPTPGSVPSQYAADWQQGFADHVNGGAPACPTGITGDACTYYLQGWDAATGTGLSPTTTNPPTPGAIPTDGSAAWQAGYSTFVNGKPDVCPYTDANQCGYFQLGYTAAAATAANTASGGTSGGTSGTGTGGTTSGTPEPGSTGSMAGTPISQCGTHFNTTSGYYEYTIANPLTGSGVLIISYDKTQMVICGSPPLPIDPATCASVVRWRPDLGTNSFERASGGTLVSTTAETYTSCLLAAGGTTGGATGSSGAVQTSSGIVLWYHPSVRVVCGSPPIPYSPTTLAECSFNPGLAYPFSSSAGVPFDQTKQQSYPSDFTSGVLVGTCPGMVAKQDALGETFYTFFYPIQSTTLTGGTGTGTGSTSGSSGGTTTTSGGGSTSGVPIVGDLVVSGNETVSGNVTIGGNLTLAGSFLNLAGQPYITVTEAGYTGGDLEVTGSLRVDGDINLGGAPNPVAGPTLLAQVGTGMAVGVYEYVIANVTAQGETAPSAPASVTTTTGNQQVKVSLPAAPPNVTARKIYRSLVGATGAWYLTGTVNGNVTSFTVDSLADAALGVSAPIANTTRGKVYGFTSAEDDLLIGGASGELVVLGKGAEGTTLQVYGGHLAWRPVATSSGGTVTSVAMTVPSVLTVSGSPITTVGTFALDLATQAPNLVLAGPVSGASATPTMRALVAADLPLATAGAFGAVKPDGSSITISAGVLSAAAVPGVPAGGTAGQVLAKIDATDYNDHWVTPSVGTGTVTSVAMTVPSVLTITGSPITTTGTLAIDLATQASGTVLAGPVTGASATPAFRALVGSDLPLATVSAFGAVKPDGSTVTISAGVISAAAGSGATVATTTTLGTVKVDNNGGSNPVAITKAGLLVAAPVDSLTSLIKIGDGAFDGGANSFIGNANGTFLGINAATTLPYPTAVLADSPIVYYRLNDATATMVDASGNGYNGSYTGTYTLQSPGATNDSSGSVFGLGKVAQVAGISSHLPSGNAARTVECIIKMPNGDSNADGAYIDFGSDATNQDFYISHSGNGVNFNVGVGAGREHVFQGGASLSNGAWHHLAVTYDGTTMTAYHNGSAVGTWVPGALGTVPSTIYLGGDAGNHIVNNHQNCYTDEVAIYGTALSSARILAHYNAISQAAGTYAGDWLDFQFGGIPIVKIAGNGDITAGKFNGIVPGAGTVSSVGLTVPSILTVTGSPVTGSGTLAVDLATQAPNLVLAGPTSGATAAPTMRSLVAADLPLATTGAFGAVKPDGTSITIAAGVISSTGGGGGGSGTGASVNKVQLSYTQTTGLTGPTASTWVDLIANQAFTVDDGQSTVDIYLTGTLQGLNASFATDYAAVLVIDSAGTSQTFPLGSVRGPQNIYAAVPLNSPITLTGLAAGSHTIKLQVQADNASSNFFVVPQAISGGTTGLTLKVIERKVVATGASGTLDMVRANAAATTSLGGSNVTYWVPFTANDSTFTTNSTMHSTSVNPTRFVAPTSGRYRIHADAFVTSVGGGYVDFYLRINGTTIFGNRRHAASSDGNSLFEINEDYYLNANDYVELGVLASGGSPAIQASPAPSFSMQRIDGYAINAKTTLGDMEYGGTGGVPTRLPAPTATNTYIGNVGGTPTWLVPPGTELGYAQITSSVTTSSTTAVDATGLSVTVTVPASGAVIEFWCEAMDSLTTNGARMFASIVDVTSSTTLATAIGITYIQNGSSALAKARHIPGAGSRQYKVQFWCEAGGTGTGRIAAATSAPAFIRVTSI